MAIKKLFPEKNAYTDAMVLEDSILAQRVKKDKGGNPLCASPITLVYAQST